MPNLYLTITITIAGYSTNTSNVQDLTPTLAA